MEPRDNGASHSDSKGHPAWATGRPNPSGRGAPSTVREGMGLSVAPLLSHVATQLASGTLTELRLNNTPIAAEWGGQLAAAIRSSPCLDQLVIQGCAVSNTVVEVLSPALRACRNLKGVNLQDNAIGADGAAALASVVSSCSTLQSLMLRHNHIGPDGATYLAAALKASNSVAMLHLSSNGIGDTGALAFAEVLRCNTPLETLTLSMNHIGDKGGMALGEAIKGHRSLKILALHSNDLGDATAVVFAEVLSTNHTLHATYFQNNPFGVEGACEFASGIARNTSLRQFYWNMNVSGREGALAMADAIAKHPTLTDMGLSTTCLDDESISAVAAAVAQNKTLQQLICGGHDVQDVGGEAVASMLGVNSTLRVLTLHNTMIGDSGLHSLGEALMQNTVIEQLSLNSDAITDQGLEKFAPTLEHKATHVSVRISGSKLSNAALATLERALAQGTCVLSGSSNVPIRTTQALEGLRKNTVERISLDNAGDVVQFSELGLALKGNTSLKSLALYNILSAGSHGAGVRVGEARKIFSPAGEIADAIKTHPALTEVLMNRCHLAGPGAQAMASAIASNTTLRRLELMSNPCGDDGAAACGSMLSMNTTLEELSLCFTGMTADGAAKLAAGLAENQTLRVLRVRNNTIGDDGAKAFSDVLARPQSTLQSLSLDANHIGDTGAIALSEALKVNTRLQSLSLGLNSVGDVGIAAIADSLRGNTALTALYLLNNRIGDDGLAALCTALSHNTALRTAMVLTGNPIRTLGVEFLHTRDVAKLDLSLESIAWPPESVVSGATAADRSGIYAFLDSAAASSSLLVRSRLMLLGDGGAGKTTLKTALLLPASGSDEGVPRVSAPGSEKGCLRDGETVLESPVTRIRSTILEVVRVKWREADVRSWVDNDLARSPGFFDMQCPAAAGITGARWLEYTHDDLIAVFGAANTEAARRVVKKMAAVLGFLLPQSVPPVVNEPDVQSSASKSEWGWVLGVMSNAVNRAAPFFSDNLGGHVPIQRYPSETPHEDLCGPDNAGARADAATEGLPYAVLLDMPHVWTEGVELERWDEAGFTIWDMPGQMELYPAHRMFSASATAVYALLLRGDGGADQCTVQLRQWLGSLRLGLKHVGDGVPKIDVRLVLSHTDELTLAERQALLREVHGEAVARFSDAFAFGATCFATEYGEPDGGTHPTGVASLRADLMRLRAATSARYTLPTAYQHVCDAVVTMARSAEHRQWPVVPTKSLSLTPSSEEAILGCLQDLGFLCQAGEKRVILEPVIWLSRLMAAFLHPYHGVCQVLQASAVATSLEAHIEAATVTTRAACRVVNARGQTVHRDNEDEILELLSHFDICFHLDRGRYVFPALLPPVSTTPPWLKHSLRSDSTLVRQYSCGDTCDTVPPTLSGMLVEALIGGAGHTAVFLARCTAVVYSREHKTYFGVHQSTNQRTLDVFAAGSECQSHLSLITMHLAALVDRHFPRLALDRAVVTPCSEQDADSATSTHDPFSSSIHHPLLGHCTVSPKEQGTAAQESQEFVSVLRELAAGIEAVPPWLWQLHSQIIEGTLQRGPQRQGSLQDHVDSAWTRSLAREKLKGKCETLSSWIDLHIELEGSESNMDHHSRTRTQDPLRGISLLTNLVNATAEATTSLNSGEPVRTNGTLPPHECGITFDTLQQICEKAKELGGDEFSSWTMRDVNNRIVKPLCDKVGTSLATHYAPAGLTAEVFVSHAWMEPFGQFVQSIFDAYHSSVQKPTLWICTFALRQSDDPDVIAAQIGAPDVPLRHAPFVQAMERAKEMLVVRNRTVDIYTRLWCVCEVYFAHEFDLVPGKTRVAGSDAFADAETSCLEAKCRNVGDRVRIIHALVGGGSLPDPEQVTRIDAVIQQFRQFAGDREMTVPMP